jgi:hypothetical protein
MSAVLEKYEAAAELTRRMLAAARTQDWDVLTAVGAERDGLFASLPETLSGISAPESSQMRRLIHEMLACHAEIADHAGPWLEHTATLLAAFDRANTLSAHAGEPHAK